MRCAWLAALFAGLFVGESVCAGPRTTIRYPRVYGATGHPYGPTQAYYQYQRQYGRPWHGYGGNTVSVVRRGGYAYGANGGSPLTYYRGPVGGYSCSLLGGLQYYGGIVGPSGYGPVYGYSTMAPLVMQGYPLWIGTNPFNNDALRRAQLENELRWKMPLVLTPGKTAPARIPNPSTPAARVKSLQAQFQGDAHLQRQEYHKAYARYKVSLQTAPDRPEPFFRAGFTLAALGQFQSAIQYFQRGLQLDPEWPTNGESLGKIYGRENTIATNATMSNVIRWTRDDIRDPDRLFLFGIFLHFSNQTSKAALVFETAYRLAGRGDHLKAFLVSPLYTQRPKQTGQPIFPPAKKQPPSPPQAHEPHRPGALKPPIPPLDKPAGKTGGGSLVPPLPSP